MNAPLPNIKPDEILRGFETVRWNSATQAWDRVATWRGTELALRQAASDVSWLNERHPLEQYELRALVSVPRPTKPLADSGPLVLTADEPMEIDGVHQVA